MSGTAPAPCRGTSPHLLWVPNRGSYDPRRSTADQGQDGPHTPGDASGVLIRESPKLPLQGARCPVLGTPQQPLRGGVPGRAPRPHLPDHWREQLPGDWTPTCVTQGQVFSTHVPRCSEARGPPVPTGPVSRPPVSPRHVPRALCRSTVSRTGRTPALPHGSDPGSLSRSRSGASSKSSPRGWYSLKLNAVHVPLPGAHSRQQGWRPADQGQKPRPEGGAGRGPCAHATELCPRGREPNAPSQAEGWLPNPRGPTSGWPLTATHQAEDGKGTLRHGSPIFWLK